MLSLSSELSSQKPADQLVKGICQEGTMKQRCQKRAEINVGCGVLSVKYKKWEDMQGRQRTQIRVYTNARVSMLKTKFELCREHCIYLEFAVVDKRGRNLSLQSLPRFLSVNSSLSAHRTHTHLQKYIPCHSVQLSRGILGNGNGFLSSVQASHAPNYFSLC